MTTPNHQSRVVLQRILTDRSTTTRELYWRFIAPDGSADCVARYTHADELMVSAGMTLRFDTYFGGFFEQHWRRNTRLADLRLEVRVAGACELRVFRTTADGVHLLHEQLSDGDATIEVPIPAQAHSFRQYGLLWCQITALDTSVIFRGGSWTDASGRASTVGLGVVFCTFNREAEIGSVLQTLVADPAVMQRIARIFVVNQGRSGLAGTPAVQHATALQAEKIRIIEQDNFGGAGGFGRGLLEALDDDTVTHIAFLDDDILIEPDSLLRMASLFALANDDSPVGGHMLDSVQPTRLYEAGAVIGARNWSFNPQHHMLDIADPGNLGKLIGPPAIHYNGWWCFGFSKQIVHQMGMPLPCFIRGDDTEFGLRLYAKGIPTLPFPGIAVWHEPFYLKIGGWQLYYETRNMLIAAACHFEFEPRGVAVRMLKHLLVHLLTFRYYSAALIVRGIEDFLKGPDLLGEPPQALHKSLTALRILYPVETIDRAQVLDEAPVPVLPRGRVGYWLALARVLLRNAITPTRHAPARRLHVQAFSWVVLARADHIALDNWWDPELLTLRRSREHFLGIARQGVLAIVRLYRRAPQARTQWRDAHPRLTSETFWRGYLQLREDEARVPEPTPSPHPPATTRPTLR